MAVTVETLKAQAVERTGLTDFDGDWFERPLRAWAEDIAGPSLNESSRAFFGRLAVTNLCRRLEVIDWFSRYPEIDDATMPPILYITGLERSGTTFLHNLLALHPMSRALLRWEMMRPAPPPEAGAYRSDPRIAEVQASLERLRGTPLEHMHWVNADEPEECPWAFLNCTGLLGLSVFPLMPTWLRWLIENDLTPSFLEYRRLIKFLTWRNPLRPGGHLVLKSPQSARNIGPLSLAFPEARFVFTHRDPFRVCVSSLSLFDQITAPFSARGDLFLPDGPGTKAVIGYLELAMSRLLEFDQTSSAGIAHVAYPTLVRDPLAALRGIYDHFGIDAPGDLGVRIAAYVLGQSAGARAAPLTELATYGLDHDTFLGRPVVAAYCSRFGVEPERSRITGA